MAFHKYRLSFSSSKESRDIEMQELQNFYTNQFSHCAIDLIKSIGIIEFNVDGHGGVLLEEETAKRGNNNKVEVKRELKILRFPEFEDIIKNQEKWFVSYIPQYT